jgi:tRNA nucleotidyltransferase (CCA-adding enzyme)
METYLVGGAVRDKLLRYPVTERDWVVVGATEEQMKAAGFTQVGNDFPVFLHPTSKEEYALARTERKTGKGYTGFECYASVDVTLEQDLLRRDLTINAMAEDSNGQLIDPHGGQADLNNKLLRHVSSAFREDPLRVLRVARFYARYYHLGFSIAEETLTLMQNMVQQGMLEELVPERVWMEIKRSLAEQSPEMFFYLLQDIGGLAKLIPSLAEPTRFHTAISNLTSVRRENTDNACRFSTLFINTDVMDIRKWCSRYRVPREHQDLALLIARYQHSVSLVPNYDGRLIVELLESLDAYRRSSRFKNFIDVCRQIITNEKTGQKMSTGANLLYRAWQESQSLSSKDVDSQLQGVQIGEAISGLRCAAINKLLESGCP